MRPSLIDKAGAELSGAANWQDTAQARTAFSWAEQAKGLAGPPPRRL